MKSSLKSLSFAACMAMSSISFAQFVSIPPAGAVTDLDGYGAFGTIYTVSGEINTNPGTLGLLSADIRIDFLGSSASSVDAMVVTIANTSTADSLLSSFYLTKPLSGNTPLTPTLDNTVSNPDDWNLDTSLDSQFNNYVTSDFGLSISEQAVFRDSYYGAYFGTRLPDGSYDLSGTDPLPAGEVGQFTFSFDTTFSINDWRSSFEGQPLFFVRWQNVSYSEDGWDFNGDSGKGYGAELEQQVVPEPSEIALLSLLGLGGLLWARKRFLARERK